jgi:hypothetical protein
MVLLSEQLGWAVNAVPERRQHASAAAPTAAADGAAASPLLLNETSQWTQLRSSENAHSTQPS